MESSYRKKVCNHFHRVSALLVQAL